MKSQELSELQSLFGLFTLLAGTGGIALGLFVLLMWLLYFNAHLAIPAGLLSINPLTAFAFILVGLSLRLMRPATPRAHAVGRVCAAIVALIAAAKLLTYLGWENGIDTLLLFGRGTALSHPIAISFIAALGFLMTGLALLFLDTEFPRGQWPSQIFCVGGLALALVTLVGYGYGIRPLLASSASFDLMELNTALAFAVLNLGILCVRPERGLMALAISEGPGGATARNLLPAMIIIPTCLAWVRLFIQEAGLMQSSSGSTLFATASILIFALLIWWNAASLQQVNLERQRSEEMLRRRAREIEDLYNNAPCAYHSLDKEGVFVRINDTELNWLGYERDEILNRKRFSDVLAPESAKAFIECYPKFKESGSIADLQLEMVRKDGVRFPVLLSASAIRDSDGSHVMRRVTLFDISERMRLEEGMRELTIALQNAVVGISRLDAQGRYLSVNQAYADMLGRRPEELQGQDWLSLAQPEDREKMAAAYQQSQAEGRSEIESRVVRQDGESIHAQIVMIKASSKSGSAVGCHCFMKDVSERIKAEQKFREAAEMKADFAAMVSHELRTPLSSIKTGIDMVWDGSAGAVNDEQKHFLDVAKRNVDRLARLINEVLDFQQLESGRMDFHMQPEDINEVVREVVQTFAAPAQEKGLTLATELAEAAPRVMCDRDKMSQVIINLVNNAIKFTTHGTVTIRTENMGDRLRLTVVDQGTGIKEEDKGKLFQSFVRLQASGKKIRGSGLGLAISRRMVENHGGQIGVESVYGKGSSFYFVIPYKAAA